MRAYRNANALMVQPEPEGAAHSAPHSGEGVGSRDSEPGVQGQGEPRENVNERGLGKMSAGRNFVYSKCG